MLTTARPILFHRAMQTGKSGPCLLTCECDNGDKVDIIGKFSQPLERGEASLAVEVISACLAADLGLPIPQPHLLSIDADWADSIPDPAQRRTIQASSFIAFGSTFVGTGFRTWIAGQPLGPGMRDEALAIFAFDSFIANPDRRDANPNCLIKGNQIRIIDHELSFFYRGVIGWRLPWVVGSLASMAIPGNHIFFNGLRGGDLNFAPIQTAWEGVDNDRLQAYREAVPQAWNSADAVNDAIELIQGVRDNIAGALAEVQRVLS